VYGDAYAGETFRRDFSDCKVDYVTSKQSKYKSELYEIAEVGFNAGQIELLDNAKLRQQLFTLVVRGASIDHQPGAHDDWANAACGALVLANPDRFGGAEGWIRFYRDLSARDAAKEAVAIEAPPPTLREEYPHLALCRASNRSRSSTPCASWLPTGIDASTFYGASGWSCLPQIENGERVFYISKSDAVALLGSPMPSTVPRIETNRSFIAELKESIVTGPQPSIRVADLLQPLEDRRSWTIWDRGGQVHDSLRLMGRMR
jgi:hypothetical protein